MDRLYLLHPLLQASCWLFRYLLVCTAYCYAAVSAQADLNQLVSRILLLQSRARVRQCQRGLLAGRAVLQNIATEALLAEQAYSRV